MRHSCCCDKCENGSISLILDKRNAVVTHLTSVPTGRQNCSFDEVSDLGGLIFVLSFTLCIVDGIVSLLSIIPEKNKDVRKG